MRRTIAALLVLLALPVAADAQMAPAPGQMRLEITKQESPPESKLGRLVVPPAPQTEDAVRDAERGVADLVEGPEVADAEHLATDRAEPDAEGQVEPSVGVADELVGVEARRHDNRGERVRVLGGVPAEEREPQRAHRAPARLGEPRVAG